MAQPVDMALLHESFYYLKQFSDSGAAMGATVLMTPYAMGRADDA